MSTATAVKPAASADRRAWVEQIMGMPVSVHVRGEQARSDAADAAVQALFADLREADATFSTYREDSEISRLQRGELAIADASREVREVRLLCQTALERTGGYFDAWASVPDRPGVFDPTGLVKTWALARSARRLDAVPGLAYAVGIAGDMAVRQGSGTAREPWRIGIEDPRDRSRVLATVPVLDGGIATSGSAARGKHILDPFSGEPTSAVLAATVVGPSVMWADVFATAAVARGLGAIEWVKTLHGTSGLLVMDDGDVHEWSNPV